MKPVPLPPLDAIPDGSLERPSQAYRMQPNDLIRVKFLYHPELDMKLPIRPDGVITLQITGDIQAAGLTTGELEEVIKQRSKEYLRDPEVSVILSQMGPRSVYVGGEVRVPGFVAFRDGMTPLQAVMDRGGFTDVARKDSVVRVSPIHSEYSGTRIDFTKTLAGGAAAEDHLAAGDVLYVPRTFIGDVNVFVKTYIYNVLPLHPNVGAFSNF